MNTPPVNEYYPLPVFLDVQGRKCVVVGGGPVALRKVTDLLESGAIVGVVAEKPSPEIERLYKQGKTKLVKRRFRADDISGAFLVFAATDDAAKNAEISATAKKRSVLVNTVDSPELCDFISGAVVKRGPLQIAISTNGQCPAIASTLRGELEKLYTESFGEFILIAGKLRQKILLLPDIASAKKHEAIKWLARKETFALFLDSGKEKVWEELKKIVS